jgi:predicted DNA-binding transcriptional regulator AlpA
MTNLMTVDNLRELFQLGRTSVYAITTSKGFPAPYALSGRIKRGPVEEIETCLESQRANKEVQEVTVEPIGMATVSGFTIHTCDLCTARARMSPSITRGKTLGRIPSLSELSPAPIKVLLMS